MPSLAEDPGALARLLDALPDAMIACDADLRVTAWNAATVRGTGIPRAQAVGRSVLELFPYVRGTAIEHEYRRALAGEVVDGRDRCWTPTGTETPRWFDVTYRPMRDDAGTVVGCVVVTTDVTTHRAARDRPARERRLLRTVIDSAPFGMLAFDCDLRITEWNAEAERRSGRRRADVLGRLLVEELPDLVGSDVLRDYERTLAGETVHVRDRWYEYPGTPARCYDAVFAPMHDGRGAVIGGVMMAVDVTERATADRAQRNDRAFLRTLIDESPASIVAFDRALRQTEWNQRAERNTGIPRAAALGRTSSELFPGFEGTSWHALALRVLDGESVQGLDYTVVDAATATPIALDVTMVPLRDAIGAIVGALVLSLDVTERVRVQRALEESELRYRLLFERSAVAQLVVDEATRTVAAANDAAVALFGHARDVLVGLALERLQGDGVTAPRDEVVPVGRHHYRDAAGAMLVVDAYATTVTRDARRMVHATLVDVTASVRAEAERDRLIRIVEATADLVATANPATHRITYVNPAGRALLGFDSDAPLWVEDVVAPEDMALVFDVVLPEALQAGVWRGEVRLRSRDGRVVPTSAVVVAHHDADGVPEFVSAIVRDVSEETRRREELRAAHEAAERASHAKSHFLTSLSHEMRTPLGAVIGFAQLLFDLTDPPLTARHRDYLSDVLAGARHLHAIVDDVLDLARVEAGVIDVRPEAVDLRVLVAEALATVAPLATQHGVRLEHSVADDAARIVTDPGRVRQVLLNYLTNGIKFNAPGGAVHVEVHAVPGGDVRLSVRDTGRGIAREALPRLFVEFQRLGERTVPGTGLGLAITRRIVDAMGGTVHVESEPGIGSTFDAVLPRVFGAPRVDVATGGTGRRGA